VRSTKPNAALSHATAARTSGYDRTGTTAAGGTDLLCFISPTLPDLAPWAHQQNPATGQLELPR
jgi:hypothetical protein